MNKDLAKEMIGHRGVYEIEYKKDETVKILHISNTICSPKLGDRAYTEVKKNDDVSTFFKESDNAGPFGWSERYEGYKILGFKIVCEYDAFVCNKNIVKMLIEE